MKSLSKPWLIGEGQNCSATHAVTRGLPSPDKEESATIEAAMRADEMLEKGDLDGQAVWLRVLRTVKELQETEPRSDTAVH